MDTKINNQLKVIKNSLESGAFEESKKLINSLTEAGVDNGRLSLYRYCAYNELENLSSLTDLIALNDLDCLSDKMLISALEDIAKDKENGFSDEELESIIYALDSAVASAMNKWEHGEFTFYKTDSIYQGARCASLLKHDEEALIKDAKRAMAAFEKNGVGNTLIYHGFGSFLEKKGLIKDFEFDDINNGITDCIYQYSLKDSFRTNKELYENIKSGFGPRLSKKFFETFTIVFLEYVGAKIDSYWFDDSVDHVEISTDYELFSNYTSYVDIKQLACYKDSQELLKFIDRMAIYSGSRFGYGEYYNKCKYDYLDIMCKDSNDSPAIARLKEKLCEDNPTKYEDALKIEKEKDEARRKKEAAEEKKHKIVKAIAIAFVVIVVAFLAYWFVIRK